MCKLKQFASSHSITLEESKKITELQVKGNTAHILGITEQTRRQEYTFSKGSDSECDRTYQMDIWC
ncbi:unnamed protein product [Brugia pahangi]|uniref:Uncharacterized protein n=1 Tax=Brugia pahangi TaxID=6280 RepID=A0A0N4TQ63_BRUPA|nr:unnamed protein product [Brugia pahangi]